MVDDKWEPFRPLTAHERFVQICNEIEDKYSGDFDTMPGLPPVTYTEMRLLKLVMGLEQRVNQLEEIITGKEITQ